MYEIYKYLIPIVVFVYVVYINKEYNARSASNARSVYSPPPSRYTTTPAYELIRYVRQYVVFIIEYEWIVASSLFSHIFSTEFQPTASCTDHKINKKNFCLPQILILFDAASYTQQLDVFAYCTSRY